MPYKEPTCIWCRASSFGDCGQHQNIQKEKINSDYENFIRQGILAGFMDTEIDFLWNFMGWKLFPKESQQ